MSRRGKTSGEMVVGRVAMALGVYLAGCGSGFALNPSLDISQYGHNAWTVRGGYSLGNVYAIAQTPDGYLWLGGEFGLFRFDGVRSIPWQPPAGQHLPDKPSSLLVTRDGTLWIGTFAGLATSSGGKLTRYPEPDGRPVTSLLEDREGTVWAGLQFSMIAGLNAMTSTNSLDASFGTHAGRLCAMRNGRSQCYGEDGAFGSFVSGLYEDSSGTLWAGAESGLWRWKPGPPRRYATPGMQIHALSKTYDGRVLIAMLRAGLKQVVGDKLETYPIRDAIQSIRMDCVTKHTRFVTQSIRIDCSETAMSIRINCSGTAMEVYGLEPGIGGSSMYMRAGQTYLRNPMASQATPHAVFSRIARGMCG